MQRQRISRVASSDQHHAGLPGSHQISFGDTEIQAVTLNRLPHVGAVLRLQEFLRGIDQSGGADLQNQRPIQRIQAAVGDMP